MWLRWGNIAWQTSSMLAHRALEQGHRMLASSSHWPHLFRTSYDASYSQRFAHGFGDAPPKCFTSYRLRECVRAAAIPDASSNGKSASSVEYVWWRV